MAGVKWIFHCRISPTNKTKKIKVKILKKSKRQNFSHFYSLLQDMDKKNINTNESSAIDNATTAAFGCNNDLKKRKRKVDDEDDNNDYPFSSIS